MRATILYILGTGFLVTLNLTAQAANRHVPDDYTSIQAAVNAAEDGDTIQIAAGIYIEQIQIHQKNLTLLGEPLTDRGHWQALLERVEGRERIARRVDLRSGHAELCEPGASTGVRLHGDTFWQVFGPCWRLVLVGAGQIARAAARLAQSLDFEVVVCEPRQRYARAWDVTEAELRTGDALDALRGLGPDGHTAVLSLAHDPNVEDLVLLEALHSPAFYVGALGSVRNARARAHRLSSALDCEPGALARLDAPAGIAIGSRTPAEIALSALAAIVAARSRIGAVSETSRELQGSTGR